MSNPRGAYRSFLLGFVAGLLCALVAWGAWRSLVALRRGLQIEVCKARLKGFELAVKAYADSHGGYLPASLSELVEGGHLDEKVLRCPVSGEAYIYFFEGEHVRADQVDDRDCLVADRGFPHRRDQRRLKCALRWHGEYFSREMEDFVDNVEDTVDMATVQQFLWATGRARPSGAIGKKPGT